MQRKNTGCQIDRDAQRKLFDHQLFEFIEDENSSFVEP